MRTTSWASPIFSKCRHLVIDVNTTRRLLRNEEGVAHFRPEYLFLSAASFGPTTLYRLTISITGQIMTVVLDFGSFVRLAPEADLR